jgi:hypothetical protein
MELPRSLRSGERNGAKRRFSKESGTLLGRLDVVLLCQRFSKQEAIRTGRRKRALRDSSR